MTIAASGSQEKIPASLESISSLITSRSHQRRSSHLSNTHSDIQESETTCVSLVGGSESSTLKNKGPGTVSFGFNSGLRQRRNQLEIVLTFFTPKSHWFVLTYGMACLVLFSLLCLNGALRSLSSQVALAHTHESDSFDNSHLMSKVTDMGSYAYVDPFILSSRGNALVCLSLVVDHRDLANTLDSPTLGAWEGLISLVLLVNLHPQSPAYTSFLHNITRLTSTWSRLNVHLVNHYGYPSPRWSILINLARVLSPASTVLVLSPLSSITHGFTYPDPLPSVPLSNPQFVLMPMSRPRPRFSSNLANFLDNILAVYVDRDSTPWFTEKNLSHYSTRQQQWEEWVWTVWLESFGSCDLNFIKENTTYATLLENSHWASTVPETPSLVRNVKRIACTRASRQLIAQGGWQSSAKSSLIQNSSRDSANRRWLKAQCLDT